MRFKQCGVIQGEWLLAESSLIILKCLRVPWHEGVDVVMIRSLLYKYVVLWGDCALQGEPQERLPCKWYEINVSNSSSPIAIILIME